MTATKFTKIVPVILAVLLLTVFIWLIFPPTLQIEVCSQQAETSYVFLYYRGHDQEYWSDNSPLQPGCQILTFDLTDYHDPTLYWRLPATSSLLVRDSWLQIGWIRAGISTDSFYPFKQVESIQQTPDGLLIVTQKASDPQIALTLSRPRRIAVLHWGISLLYASLLMLIVAGAAYLSQKNWDTAIQRGLTQLKAFAEQEDFQASEFAVLAGISIVLNLYSLTNFSLSIDDEMAAFRLQPDIWLEEGRWTTYFLERFIFHQPVIAYAPHLIFALSIAVAYIFLIRTHKLPKDWRTYLTFPVFGAFPTWLFIAVFHANLPSVSLGIILAVLAGFIFERTRFITGQAFWIWSSLQAIMLAIAAGGYQSFLLMYLAIGIGVTFMDCLSSHQTFPIESRKVRSSLIRLGVIALAGFVFYSLINSLTRNLIAVNPSAYIESFWNFKTLFTSPGYVLFIPFLSEMRAYYSGSAQKFGFSLLSLGVMITLSWLTVASRLWLAEWKKRLLLSFLWIGLIITPFLLNIVSAKELPTRSFFALPYVVWLMSILLLQSKRVTIKLFNALVIAAFILQILFIQGTYAAIASFTQQQDRQLAYDLFRRMSEIDDGFTTSQTISVDFYGTKRAELIYPNPYGGTMGASFFEFTWKDDDIARMINFMKLMGYTNLQAADREQRLSLTPYFEAMPAWPAPGCVQKVNGVYLIKLNDIPDPLHAQFQK